MENKFIKYPEIGKVYKHYKGGKYEVMTLAKHTETDEVMVVYKSVHFGSVHVRPLSMWFEIVPTGDNLARFTLCEE
jgi:hypothetical protein